MEASALLTVVIPGAQRLSLHHVDALREHNIRLDAPGRYPLVLKLAEGAPLLSGHDLDGSHAR